MKGPQNAGVVHDGVSANQQGMSSIGPDIEALLPTSCRKTKGAGGYGSMPKNVGIDRTKVFACLALMLATICMGKMSCSMNV